MNQRQKSGLDRREFLEFLGGCGAASIGWSVSARADASPKSLKPLARSQEDLFRVAEGLKSQVLIRWGDKINDRGETFGINNDFTACLATSPQSLEAILWVNHESPDLVMLHEGAHLKARTKEQIVVEQKSVGGSILTIRRKSLTDSWSVDVHGKVNRRVSAETTIPFDQGAVAGQTVARGTMGNCSGGVTPWGTFLTCEENTEEYYGKVGFDLKTGQIQRDSKAGVLGWSQFFTAPPEHYGWVVEVEPKTGSAKKLTGLGRFAHEGALVTRALDGRIVVYMGDDANDQCLYKFVGERGDSLAKGVLWVANLDQGRWLPLDINQNAALKQQFSTQRNVQVFTREAAALVGGTPLDRPEGIAQHPLNKGIFISLTNNFPKGRPFGSILRIDEKGADPGAVEFQSQQFLAGGPESGLACPDNIVFDPRGNLWITTDVAGSSLNKPPFEAFGNNGLYVVPATGPDAGRPVLLATAPVGAELTGPSFAPDHKTLFLSVQHPGEGGSKADGKSQTWSSHWPDGGKPRSAVVALSGPTLEMLALG